MFNSFLSELNVFLLNLKSHVRHGKVIVGNNLSV